MPIPLGILAVAGAGAAGGSDYRLIQTQILGTNAASVEFTSIPSTYKHLELRVVSAHNNSGGSTLAIRFNNDTGNNYAHHQLAGNGTSVSSSATTSTSRINAIIHQGSNTNFGAAVVTVLDYANTNKTKTARSLTGVTGEGIRLVSGFRNNTEAITSIQIFDIQSFSILAGSRFSLYGIS